MVLNLKSVGKEFKKLGNKVVSIERHLGTRWLHFSADQVQKSGGESEFTWFTVQWKCVCTNLFPWLLQPNSLRSVLNLHVTAENVLFIYRAQALPFSWLIFCSFFFLWLSPNCDSTHAKLPRGPRGNVTCVLSVYMCTQLPHSSSTCHENPLLYAFFISWICVSAFVKCQEQGGGNCVI